MATFLTPAELTHYPLSDGTTVNLAALVGTGVPTTWTRPTSQPAVGTVVYVDAMGAYRRGVVVKVTPTKVQVALTTRGAIENPSVGWQGVRMQLTLTLWDTVFTAPEVPPTPAESVTATEAPLFHTL